jgi:hypothetical protein
MKQRPMSRAIGPDFGNLLYAPVLVLDVSPILASFE